MPEVTMIEVLVFFALLAAVTWALRVTAVWYLHRNAPPVLEEPTTTVGTAQEDEDLIAILTAAAMAVLQKPVTLRRVRFLTPPANNAWSVTGRLNVMGSHLITKRNQ
jgi:hypothetical protein